MEIEEKRLLLFAMCDECGRRTEVKGEGKCRLNCAMSGEREWRGNERLSWAFQRLVVGDSDRGEERAED